MWIRIGKQEYSLEQIQKLHYKEGLSEYGLKTLEFCSSWINGQNDFLIHTSGSTGKPKEIKITRENMIRSARMTAAALNLQKGDHALVCINTAYIGGKMMLVRSLEVGMNMTIVEPSSNPLTSFTEEHFDFTAMVPIQIQTIVEESPEKINLLNGMKAIILGGSAVSKTLEEKIQVISSPVYQTFGMTETVSHIALRKLNGKDKLDYYKALEAVSFKQDERECLVIHSPFSNEALITNDIVELIDDKKFIWKGRYDHVINSGGIKIFAEQVEEQVGQLLQKESIHCSFFIAGIPDEKLGEQVTLFAEVKNLSALDQQKISNLFPKKDWGYQTPRSIIFCKEFVSSPSGKILKKETMIQAGIKFSL